MDDTIPKTEPMPKPFICFLHYRQQQHCTRLYNGLYKLCIIICTSVYKGLYKHVQRKTSYAPSRTNKG